jgi:heat shock protein HslJ
MTEEQKDREGAEEAQEEVALEEGAADEEIPVDTPAEEQRKGWPIVVTVLAVILALCIIVACIAAAVAIFATDGEETPVPTAAPLPTTAPVQAVIVISEPDQGDVVDITKPVTVQGKGVGLPEGNLVVEALDWQGNVLDRQPATLQGRDVGTGGEGTWSVELEIEVEPATAGRIWAYAESPKDGSIMAEDLVEVSLGSTKPVKAYIKIDAPTQGAILDISRPVLVRGSGSGLPEGNVVVEALDWQGKPLDRQATTLQGPDVGTGGEGTWSIELQIEADPGTAGRIRAYAESPKDGSIIAEDAVEVSLGSTKPVKAYIKIDEPAQGAVLDIERPVLVRGSGAGLPEANVVVEALDWEGNVLDQRPAILQGSDVGTGGEGTWSVQLGIRVEPGTAGSIRAYSPSPADGSIVAEDSVEVSLGQTPAVQPQITIDEPIQGAVLDIDGPVVVRGRGAGLPEGNLVVEAIDAQGYLLDRQAATLRGSDVGTGGEGTWSATLTIEVEQGTAGMIQAYARSAEDGSIIAGDRVDVSLGQTEAVQPYITIENPQDGAGLDISRAVVVSGTGAGLPEGNLVVVAVDEDGDVLAEQPVTLQGSDVGTGGEGTWSVELAVPASGQVTGYIAAFAASPKQRELIASDHVEVTFYGEYTLEDVTWLLDKTITGTEITIEFTPGLGSEESVVTGTAGCNTFQGVYTETTRAIGRNNIKIGPLATTRKMCDQALMEQERLFLAALEAATSYRVEGFTLTIVYPGGELLFYDKDGPRPREE